MKTNRLFRIVWGLVFLASVGFLCLGLASWSSAVQETSGRNASEEYQAGVALGAGLTLPLILCLGGVPALLSGLLYWRNGVAMREKRRHEEMVAAMKGKE